MERKQPIEHKCLASLAAKDKMESSSDQPTIAVIFERLKTLSKDYERHVKLVQAIGNFIAVDMQPLSVVENKGFLELMKAAEPRFQVPSRGYYTKTVISSMYSSVREGMKKMVSKTQFVCSLLISGLQLTVTELTLVLPVMELMVIGSYTAIARVLRSYQLLTLLTTLVIRLRRSLTSGILTKILLWQLLQTMLGIWLMPLKGCVF